MSVALTKREFCVQMPGTQQATKEYAMRNKYYPRVVLDTQGSRLKKKTLKDMPKTYVMRLVAFAFVHYGTAAACWALPAVFAWFSVLPWWQGAVTGYAVSGLLMTAYLSFLQFLRRRVNLRPLLLGAIWPYASSLFHEPHALDNELEPF